MVRSFGRTQNSLTEWDPLSIGLYHWVADMWAQTRWTLQKMVYNLLSLLIIPSPLEQDLLHFLFISWYIWKARNDLHFQRRKWTSYQVLQTAQAHSISLLGKTKTWISNPSILQFYILSKILLILPFSHHQTAQAAHTYPQPHQSTHMDQPLQSQHDPPHTSTSAMSHLFCETSDDSLDW
jgi:hypothetical protein